MENKNNSLMVVTKSIFDKIKNFFRNIFIDDTAKKE